MTEQEWLTSTDPAEMLRHLEGPMSPNMRRLGAPWEHEISDRKLRLFACACCRMTPGFHTWLEHKTALWCVIAAEALADNASIPLLNGNSVDSAREVEDVGLRILCHCTQEDAYRSARMSSASPMELKIHSTIGKDQAAILRDIVGNPFRPVTLCGLERHPFHNQYAHVDANGGFWLESECPACAELRTPTVVALAKAAYSERGWKCEKCGGSGKVPSGIYETPPEQCPACHGTGRTHGHTLDSDRLLILADALEDSGCNDVACGTCDGKGVIEDEEKWHPHVGTYWKTHQECHGTGRVRHPLINHLRSPGPHYRGCHVIDLLTGRE